MVQIEMGMRKFGVKPYQEDPRDIRLTSVKMPTLNANSALPVVDLRAYCPPIKDQGNLGSCTAFASCTMREFLMRKIPSNEKHLYGLRPDQVKLSELYLYYREREMDAIIEGRPVEQAIHEDNGAQMRTAVRAMNKWGACPDQFDPYKTADFDHTPTSEATAQAYNLRGGAYHQLRSVQEMMSCIDSEYVFIVGLMVYNSFNRVGADGRVPLPKSGEMLLGGHAMCVVGRADPIQSFIVQNSWGSSWGDHGYCYIPYEYFENYEWFIDAWMQHQGPAWVPRGA